MTELRIGTVLIMDCPPRPRWGTPAGQIRYEVIRFSDGNASTLIEGWRESIPFSYDESRTGPRVWLKRLDNLATKTQPVGSHRVVSAHSVWWMLNGGGYRIEDGADQA